MKFAWHDLDDWRIERMESLGLDTPRIELILDKTLPDSANSVTIAILEPGLSGFQVLRLFYGENDADQSVVVKLRQFRDTAEAARVVDGDAAARLKLSIRQASSATVITLAGHQVVPYTSADSPDEYWLCLMYADATKGSVSGNRTTFKRLLSGMFEASDFDFEDGKELVAGVLEKYRQIPLHHKLVDAHPWSDVAKPLEQTAFHSQYLENVWQVFSSRSDLAAEIGIRKREIRRLLGFIRENKLDARSIDSTLVKVPIAEVHGDFNGGNVLVGEPLGNDVVFIDLGQMSPKPDRHALFDIGKLSIEFERFILPESAFDMNRPGMLKAWTDVHNRWIQSRSIEAYKVSQPKLYRLYSLLSVFREFSAQACADMGIDDIDEAQRHFLYVRLHYIVRMINHPHLSEERKLFAIRAALDILQFLIDEPRAVPDDGGAPVPLPDGGPPNIFDCGKDAFVDHLAQAESVIIVGITNGGLQEHLRKAWEARKGKKWTSLTIIFLARNLLRHVRDPADRGTEFQALQSREQHWDSGVRAVRQFLLESDFKAQHVEIRHSQSLLSFVGQLYDDKHVRVAFILPEKDVKTSCYINLSPDYPPCRAYYLCPTAKTGPAVGCGPDKSQPLTCETCPRKAKSSPCLALAETFEKISSMSTPLFAANVVGHLDDSESEGAGFCYSCIIPQSRWQEFTFPNKEAGNPAHFCVFAIVRYKDGFWLLQRNESNASDQFTKLGVVSRKVNDEDFFPDQPDQAHRQTVFEMQLAHYKVLDQEMSDATFWKQHLKPLAESFATKRNLQIGGRIEPDELKAIGERAAKRCFREKLSVGIVDQPIRYVPGPFVVGRGRYQLFAILFIVDVGEADLWELRTMERRSPEELLEGAARGEFTVFLNTYTEHIVEWHRKNPWINPASQRTP